MSTPSDYKPKDLSKNKKTVEMVELFSYDGVKYEIPNKTNQFLALQILEVAREHGQAASIGFMIKALVGAEAFKILTEAGIDEEDFNDIVEFATKVVFGDKLDPKASS